MISIYADGSSQGNSTEPIGWAYVIVSETGAVLAEGSGGFAVGTNNIAELTAAIEGLKKAKELALTGPLELVSDSEYTLKLANGTYIPQKNVQLAEDLKQLTEELKADTRWVKGHAGNEFNEKCDRLAKTAKMSFFSEKQLEKLNKKRK